LTVFLSAVFAMNPSPDPFEFLKSLWGPMGLPMSGVIPPTVDAGEIEKRIADLKSVETWLNVNLNVLRTTLQSLEMQKASLAALQAGAGQAVNSQGGPAPTSSNSPGVLSDAWWNVLQQATAGRKDPSQK
jgi:hypothetical protein